MINAFPKNVSFQTHHDPIQKLKITILCEMDKKMQLNKFVYTVDIDDRI